MRLLSFCHRGRRSIGVEMETGRILDLNLADKTMPASMRSFLELGDDGMDQVRRLLKNLPKGAILPKNQLQIGPPVNSDERPKVFCIGLNYADHAAESGSKVPEDPLVFAKFHTALCGLQDSIVSPPGTSSLDYEVELVVVIGKRAKRVSQAEAYDYVAGYTCGNDVSERNFQRKDSQWLRAKSSDTFAPIGPVIVTKEEIPDPHLLGLGSKVNDEIRQNSSTRQIIFQVPKLVEFISDYITLEPGDLIFTGTPPGVGFAMKPPRCLNPGDQVEVWVEGIGNLVNRVVETPW